MYIFGVKDHWVLFKMKIMLVFFFGWNWGQSKLHDLTGDDTDFLDTLSQNVRKRVDVLREIQV